MIIPNGTIQVKVKQAGGIDTRTGYPVKAQAESWGDPIPCQYSPVSLDLQSRYLGEHSTKASYSILVEDFPIDAEQVRLCGRNGAEVGKGKYSIVSVESLDAVLQTRIIV